MTARLAPAAALAMAAALAVAGPAAAFYPNGAELLSAHEQRLEQGDDSSSLPAISADGRYVAFETRASNFFDDADPDPPGRFRRGGIFLRDLPTGRLELVADGDFYDEADPAGAPVLRGAHNPSISGDGRYVVFSTAQKLVADRPERRDRRLPPRHGRPRARCRGVHARIGARRRRRAGDLRGSVDATARDATRAPTSGRSRR